MNVVTSGVIVLCLGDTLLIGLAVGLTFLCVVVIVVVVVVVVVVLRRRRSRLSRLDHTKLLSTVSIRLSFSYSIRFTSSFTTNLYLWGFIAMQYTLCFIKSGPLCIFAITFSNVDRFE